MIESFKLSHFKLCSLSRQIRVLLNALKIPYESKQRDITALSSIERISPTLLIGNKLVLNGFWSIYSYLIETNQHYLLPNSLEEKINFFSKNLPKCPKTIKNSLECFKTAKKRSQTG